MPTTRHALAGAGVLLALVLTGCGGSTGHPAPAVTVTKTVTAPAPTGSPSSATLSWTCTITATVPEDSTLWQVGFRLTAANSSSQAVTITNGANVTFTDQAGDATDTRPVSWSQVIEPGTSASFTETDPITAPASSAPASCQVAQWG